MQNKYNEIKFYRVKEVAQMLSVSKSSIWGWAKNGSFPQPIKLSKNVTVWSLIDITLWLEKDNSELIK